MISKVMEIIMDFFPQGKRFDDPEYKQSKEFLNLLRVRDYYLKDHTLMIKLQNELEAVFNGYSIVNWTNLQELNCFEFKALLHFGQPILDDDIQLIKLLGGSRTDLRIFISLLANYYYFFVEQTSYKETSQQWSFQTLTEYPVTVKENIKRLQSLMSSEGYVELTTEIVNLPIKNLETELVEEGKVKIFHCLFTDLVNP